MLKKNHWIIGLILLLFGVVLMYIQIAFCQRNSFWYSVAGNAGCAILISGVLSFLQEIVSKKDSERVLRELFGISSAIKDSGLLDIKIDSKQYSYTKLLSDSDHFYAIMNDGLRWVGNYSDELKTRFSKKTKITEFYLVDPEGLFLDALAQKTNRDLSSLKSKINETISTLNDLYNNQSSHKGDLKIYFLKNYPTQSIYYTDDIIVTTSYQTSCGRSMVPLFEYKFDKSSSNVAKHLYQDLDLVRLESKLVYVNGAKQNL